MIPPPAVVFPRVIVPESVALELTDAAPEPVLTENGPLAELLLIFMPVAPGVTSIETPKRLMTPVVTLPIFIFCKPEVFKLSGLPASCVVVRVATPDILLLSSIITPDS